MTIAAELGAAGNFLCLPLDVYSKDTSNGKGGMSPELKGEELVVAKIKKRIGSA